MDHGVALEKARINENFRGFSRWAAGRWWRAITDRPYGGARRPPPVVLQSAADIDKTIASGDRTFHDRIKGAERVAGVGGQRSRTVGKAHTGHPNRGAVGHWRATAGRPYGHEWEMYRTAGDHRSPLRPWTGGVPNSGRPQVAPTRGGEGGRPREAHEPPLREGTRVGGGA